MPSVRAMRLASGWSDRLQLLPRSGFNALGAGDEAREEGTGDLSYSLDSWFQCPRCGR